MVSNKVGMKESSLLSCSLPSGQALQELSKDKPSLKQVDGHAATFLKTLGNVDKELGKQINYLTQVSTGMSFNIRT